MVLCLLAFIYFEVQNFLKNSFGFRKHVSFFLVVYRSVIDSSITKKPTKTMFYNLPPESVTAYPTARFSK